MRPRNLANAATIAIAGLTLAATTTLHPAQAAEPSYVALGDSYSSGTGTRSYLRDGSNCLRSAYAYPSLIAASRGYGLNFRACSGATVADVSTAQLGALGTQTNYVSVSVGGNDAGFADVLTECALPAWMSNCYGAVDDARDYIRSALPIALSELYDQIGSRAPNARIVAVGYPRIFNGEDCSLLTWFSRTESSALNRTGNLLNRISRGAARDAGFRYANPTSRFIDHAVCDDTEWINGLTFPIVESFHPNRSGHASGYTPLVSPKLTGATVGVTTNTLKRARRAAPELAEQQRDYAALDRSIRPEVVEVPNLASPRAKRAAAAADVDLASRASIDRADRKASRAQARAWRSRR